MANAGRHQGRSDHKRGDFTRVAAAALALSLALASCRHIVSEPVADAATDPSCAISPQQMEANRTLEWSAFDQVATTPFTYRGLIQRGCNAAAATAYVDYLTHGPMIPGERWQTAARFHLGQALAASGRHDDAVLAIASARRETEIGEQRWNLYVQGTVAFLTRDHSALMIAQQQLQAAPGHSNAVNAGVLAGLLHCWERPYAEASAAACVAASGYRMPAG